MVDENICLKTSLGEIYLSSKWSSEKENHRKLIRHELYKKSKNADFLNLKKTPGVDINIKNFFVSISHSKDLGGYALHLTQPVGFDVESKNRITDGIVDKLVNSEIEKELSSDEKKLLWVIKEASFKACSGKAKVMTDVNIKQMSSAGDRSFSGIAEVNGVTIEFLCGDVGKDCFFAIAKEKKHER
jgi:phosphopantetheinyl transferase (holo-ACP synthase)